MPDMSVTSNRMLCSAQNDGLLVAMQFLGGVIRKRGTGLGKVAAAAVDAGCVPVFVSVTGGSDNRGKSTSGYREGKQEPASSSAWSNRISPRKLNFWWSSGVLAVA